MTSGYDRTEAYHGTWEDRSHWNRQWENQWQQKAIGNIEDFLESTDWEALQNQDIDLSSYLQASDLSALENLTSNQAGDITALQQSLSAEGNIGSQLAAQGGDISALQTSLGEEGAIGSRLGALESYFDNPDLNLTGLQGQLDGMFGHGGEGTKALQALWEEGGAGTSALDELRTSLNTDWTTKTFGDEGLTMEQISNTINQKGQTTAGLQTAFTGLFEEGGKGAEAISSIFNDGRLTDAFTDAGLVDADSLTTALEGFQENQMGTALDNLSDDLVNTYNLDNLSSELGGISTNLSKIEGLGDELGSLFDAGGAGATALSGLSTNLTGKLDTATAGLQGQLDTTGANIEGLGTRLDTTDTRLEGVDTRFEGVDTSISNLDTRVQASKDLADANKLSIAENLASIGGLQTNLDTATQNITDLRGDAKSWVDDLETATATDRARLEGLINTKSDAWNQRLTDLSSSMNYRTLGDSATGVRTRKSKARASGQTRFGTGQLNRSTSKLVGINL